MSFRLVGVDLLARWNDEPWSRSHDAVPGPNELLRVAIVPGIGWAVEFLIDDGARQVELKSFIGL